ncbi:MAG TPA: hypothetical protein VK797_28570 [Tepidisphaeraceae bacterium]|nr:hypothetical protein [Tepidisphaeraceae bacterium]
MTENGLNLFQRLTRRWEAVHPYNAGQVMRIGRRLSPSDAAGAWADALRTLGLGRVHIVDDQRFRHEALNGEFVRYPLAVLPLGTSLEDHLTRELNRPFDHADEPPFRPFLLQQDDSFYFGVVYQHWVADSVSIRSVLREWFGRLFDPAMARQAPVRHSRKGYWHLFGSRANWRLDDTVLSNFRAHMRYRRVRKVKCNGLRDYPVRVTLHRTADGLIDALRSLAKAERCKVHDVLLAGVAEACDAYVPTQARRNRPDIAVGSIVDLRRHAADDLNDTFGLFLGFTQVICRPQVLKDWPRLLKCVAAQNCVHKQSGLPQASMLWMAAAMALDRFVPDKNLYHFYRKEMPTSGGLSNVNMNDTWAVQYHPDPILEYWRISPTGPMVPLVFSTTTLGSRLTVALTCRAALMPPERSREMAGSLLDRLSDAARSHSRTREESNAF